MSFKKLTFAPPFNVHVGDLFPVDQRNHKVLQIRDGVVIAERTFTGGTDLGDLPPAFQSGLFGSLVYEEKPMTAQAITMTNVSKDNETGVISWQFGPEGVNKTIEDSLAVRDELQSTETAKKMLIAKAISNSPDGTNLETMVGVVCTIDFDANQPISFSE